MHAAAFVFLLGSVTGDSSIIGGTRPAVGDYPTVVLLTLYGSPLCTGTLISPSMVLTAGHCIDTDLTGTGSDEALVEGLVVHFDVLDLYASPGIERAAKRVIHGGFDYNKIGEKDIGLIELMTPMTDRVPSRVNISAISAPAEGTKGIMVGYGETFGGRGDGGVAFMIEDRVSAKCDDIVPAIPGLPPPKDVNVLCFAQTDDKGKCHGDSGGPTFALVGGEYMVVGITSFGDQNCAIFGADTRADIESDFILMNVPDVCTVADCDGDGDGDGGGCCDSGGGAGTSALGIGLVGFALRRRKRH